MKVLTISELLGLTKIELHEIARTLIGQLAELPEGSPERDNALATLANIRAVLARPEFRRPGAGRSPSP